MPKGIYDRSKRKTRTKHLVSTDKTLVRAPTHIRYEKPERSFNLTQVHIDSYTSGFKKGFEEAMRLLQQTP